MLGGRKRWEGRISVLPEDKWEPGAGKELVVGDRKSKASLTTTGSSIPFTSPFPLPGDPVLLSEDEP